MNIIIKIVLICIVGTMLLIFLRNNSNEFYVFVSVSIGVLIFSLLSPYLIEIIRSIKTYKNTFDELGDKIKLVLKAITISVICEFAEQVCIDSGERNIASKINFACKTIILFLSLPEFFGLVNKISSLMDSI